MKIKKILLSLMLLLSTSSLWAVFPTDPLSGGGSGTVSDPYKIATAADLLAVRDAINLSTSTVAASNYVLTSNIDMSGTEWITPIGLASKNFSGIFDGKGYKITGLFCGNSTTRNSTASVSLGLFGLVNGATIKNVQVDVSFYLSRTTVANLYLGGLVNIITGGITNIDNCRVTGIIDQLHTPTAAVTDQVGGIVGQLGGTEVYITNCSSDLQITNKLVNSGGITGCGSNAGGIVGNGVVSVKSGIVNCYSTGSILLRNECGGAISGGIMGVRNGTSIILCEIINCYSSMSIDVTHSAAANSNLGVGGISGSQNNSTPNTIKNCIALNPSLAQKITFTTVPNLKRIANKNGGATFSNNYALSSMVLSGWTAGNLTTMTGTTSSYTQVNDATGADGDLLTGADQTAQIADGLNKLNSYADVPANQIYNGKLLNSWSAGTTYPVLLPVPSLTFGVSSLAKAINEPAFIQAATSNSSGTIVYTSSNTAVATVNASTGEVTVAGTAGTTTITATQAASSNYSRAITSYTLTTSGTTAISKATTSKALVNVVNGEIVISGAKGKTIEIYNSLGRRICSTVANQNSSRISVNGKGIYLVKIANKTSKIIL